MCVGIDVTYVCAYTCDVCMCVSRCDETCIDGPMCARIDVTYVCAYTCHETCIDGPMCVGIDVTYVCGYTCDVRVCVSRCRETYTASASFIDMCLLR